MRNDVWKVVVIDDSPEDRAEVRRLLLKGSNRRYQFIEANTGADGVREALGARPHCVVLDYNLPDMAAPEVLAALTSPEGMTACPVLVLTSSANTDFGRRALRAGAQDFHGKGWMTAESLTRAVENAAERWAMARELRAIDAEYRSLFDMAGNGNSEVAIDSWQFVRANRRFCQMVGYTADELLGGMTFLDVTHPDDRERNLAEIRPFIAECEQNFEIEKRYVRKGGAVIWVHLTSSVIRDADGMATRLLGSAIDITARKEAEDQLRRNDQFNRSLMNGTADCVKVLDLEGRLLHMNIPGLCAMEIDDFGSVCGQEWETIWPADAWGDIEQSVTTAVGGEVASFQAYCPTVKGTPKWWEVTVSPVRDAEGGRVVRLLAVSRDITERKQVEDRLRASEAQFRAIFEQSAVGMAQVSAKTGRFVRVNGKYCELTGYRAEELAEMTPDDLTFANDRDGASNAFGPVLRGEVALYDQETRYLRRDAKVIWIHGSATLLRDADGRPEQTMSVVQDISERKRAEQALRESEERLRAATAAVSDLIWTNNADGLMEGEQRSWEDFTGQSREEYQGYGWSQAIHPADAQRTLETWTQVVAEKRAFAFEHRIRRRDGEWRLCSVRAVPILNADGLIREWVGVHTDITEGKRDEERLRQLAAELSEAGRRKDEFLATLAHELRNPLAPIRNGLQLMKMADGQAATIEPTRAMMERQLTQMVRLVDDLMDVGRISRGKIELRSEPVALAAVVNSAVETVSPLVEQMGHDLTVTLPDQPVVVDADLTRLAQVFLNLLNNAAKYSDPGSHIQLNVKRQGSDVIVTVKDTGIGIATDHLPHIFEMFMQVDRSLEKSQGGSGIGLTLVKRLVEMHGGTVEAKSEGLGKGSEFVVRLPVLIGAPKPQEPSSEAERLVMSSHRILIVDDNRDGADSLSEMLKIMGNDTRTAYDGQEGVDVAGEFRPDVLLFDIGLPKLNGYEACRRIREQPWGQDVVLIAVTGWGQDDDRRRSQEAGFDHHMVKPVDPQALAKLLAGLAVAKQ